MKSMVLSIALLSSAIMSATLPNDTRFAYQMNNEQATASALDVQPAVQEDDACDQEMEDAFDALLEDDEDVPSDMIATSKPVSAYEAYLKEIGIHVFMKYIAFKVWLEHHWQSWSR